MGSGSKPGRNCVVFTPAGRTRKRPGGTPAAAKVSQLNRLGTHTSSMAWQRETQPSGRASVSNMVRPTRVPPCRARLKSFAVTCWNSTPARRVHARVLQKLQFLEFVGGEQLLGVLLRAEGLQAQRHSGAVQPEEDAAGFIGVAAAVIHHAAKQHPGRRAAAGRADHFRFPVCGSEWN